ncbi:MAG: TetR/AcrR family transcriptional regulator [Anaerolineae bacterium]
MANDRRVQRTQDRLREAMAELIVQRSYESISIRDLTAAAGVGYATFFRHYPTKDALLLDLLQRSIQDLAQLIPPGVDTDSTEEGRLIFSHAQQHDKLYRILLRGEGTLALLEQVQAAAAAEVMSRFAGQRQPAIPLEILAHHLVASSIALIGWWLQRGQPYPPERMGQIYAEMIIRPFTALAGQEL